MTISGGAGYQRLCNDKPVCFLNKSNNNIQSVFSKRKTFLNRGALTVKKGKVSAKKCLTYAEFCDNLLGLVRIQLFFVAQKHNILFAAMGNIPHCL